MSRLSLLALLGVVAAGLLGFGVSNAQDSKSPAQPKGQDHMQMFMDCAKSCGSCALVCDACAAHCAKLAIDGKKDHAETMKTCQDCAAVCVAAACITARSGPFSDTICTACADACKRCGDACEKHAAHDQMMKQCMEECRKCEKACREMLTHTRPASR